LGSLDVTPDAGVSEETDMVHFNFSFVTFSVGQVYTILVTTDNKRWSIHSYSDSGMGGNNTDLYTGGQYYQNGAPIDSANYDARFRVVPLSTIPAPSALLLGSLGCGLVGWMRKRKSL
jgi:hypothetical protein